MAKGAYQLTPDRISGWIRHWLSTPPESILGTGYGFDSQALLMRSLAEWSADSAVQKLKVDIPLLAELPAGGINVLGEQIGTDTINLTFVVGAAVVTAALNTTTGALRATADR